MSDHEILSKILQEINTHTKVVFDLDSTLFDVSHRITKILHQFATIHEHQKAYPRECKILETVTPHPSDYGVRRTLERYGFTLNDIQFAHKLIEFWKEKFFSNEFIKFDQPYEGALEFVNEVKAKNAEIFYLTGRDAPRMKQSTIESLQYYNFPLHQDGSNLILKPSKNISDALFKQKYFENLKHGDYYFFENEPMNIYLAITEAPFVKPIFVDTVHSNKAPVPSNKIPKIKGWLRG